MLVHDYNVSQGVTTGVLCVGQMLRPLHIFEKHLDINLLQSAKQQQLQVQGNAAMSHNLTVLRFSYVSAVSHWLQCSNRRCGKG
jgi:hypothetical protein